MNLLMHDLDYLHSLICTFLTFIIFFVGGGIFFILKNNYYSFFSPESKILESLWTIFPCVQLLILSVPTFNLLYGADNNSSSLVSVKVTGSQWYWNYDYTDFNVNFDSFILKEGMPRSLEVDNHMVLPMSTSLIVTSSDVLHAWALPSLGMKIDAIPGRLNLIVINSKMPGVFYGQCSEICGVNHSFMPIVVEFLNNQLFKEWIKAFNLSD